MYVCTQMKRLRLLNASLFDQAAITVAIITLNTVYGIRFSNTRLNYIEIKVKNVGRYIISQLSILSSNVSFFHIPTTTLLGGLLHEWIHVNIYYFVS